MNACNQHGGAQAGLGDLVAVGVRHPRDELVHSEPAEIVGDLASGNSVGVHAAELGGEDAQLLVGEPVSVEPEGQQGGKQGVAAWLTEPKSGNASAVWCGDGVGEDGEGGGTGDRVVVESLDAEEAPVGGEADLAECGQVGQPLPDLKIVAVVDGGFGAQRSSLFVILLDRRGFVVHVQAGYDTRGDHPSTEPS